MKEAIRKNLLKHTSGVIAYVKQLKDIRLLGLHVFVVIALLVTWSSIGVIQANYELQQSLARLEQENEVRELENETLKLRNQYFETDQFIELAARKQFSKAAPGETLVLVPEEVALDRTVEPKDEFQEVVTAPEKPAYQQNFEAWMEFFFRRNANI